MIKISLILLFCSSGKIIFFEVVWNLVVCNICDRFGLVWNIQGGTINLYLGFGGRIFRIWMTFENNSIMRVIYVILHVYGEDFISNNASVVKDVDICTNLIIIHFVFWSNAKQLADGSRKICLRFKYNYWALSIAKLSFNYTKTIGIYRVGLIILH